MNNNNTAILCTGNIRKSWKDTAAKQHCTLDIIPFIITEPVDSIEVQQEVEQAATYDTAVIFTSGAAVEAVVSLLAGDSPFWKIYCVGEQTKQKLLEYFGEENIAGTAATAEELADMIIEEGTVDEMIFFCGNLRRDELPMLLEEEDITVNLIEVYNTTILEKKLEKEYDRLIFFSPSAVDGFFKNNKVSPNAEIFVIGNTTAKAVKKYCKNSVHVSEMADKDEVMREVVANLKI